MTDAYSGWDAAYVLGSLSSIERREFEEHQQHCPDCALAVRELAGLPSLLTRARREVLDSDLAPAGPAPASMLASLLERARRRRRRIRVALAGGLVVAAALVSALIYLPHRHTSTLPTQALDQVVASPLHAQIRLVSEPWGTRVDVVCQYDQHASSSETYTAPASTGQSTRTYWLMITDRDGDKISAGSWNAGPGSTVEPTAVTRVPVAQIARVQVLSDDGRVLLQLDR